MAILTGLRVGSGRRVVYISGCWEILHIGHVRVLERARALGDFLLVGVNTDGNMRTYKGEPVVGFQQRCVVVAALRCVDAVVPHHGFEDLTGFEEYGVQIRAVGPEFGVYEEQRRCLGELRRRGVKVVVLPRTEGVTTTIIKERCCETYVVGDSFATGCVGGCGGSARR